MEKSQKTSKPDSSNGQVHAMVCRKNSMPLNNLLDPAIYEIVSYSDDGTYLVRIDKMCQSILINILNQALTFLKTSNEVYECACLLTTISEQQPPTSEIKLKKFKDLDEETQKEIEKFRHGQALILIKGDEK